MKHFLGLACAGAAMALSGCATSPGPEDLPAMPEGACSADPVKAFAGRKASAEAGADLLRLSGARVLRWVPPRTAVTMDYRADRLTVGYDDDYTIVRISCG